MHFYRQFSKGSIDSLQTRTNGNLIMPQANGTNEALEKAIKLVCYGIMVLQKVVGNPSSLSIRSVCNCRFEIKSKLL